VLFLPLLLFNVNRSHLITKSYGWLDFAKIGVTFLVVCVGWVFFRADSIASAFQYLAHMFELKRLSLSLFYSTNANLMIFALSTLAIMIVSLQELIWVINKREVPKLSSVGTLILVLLIFFMGSFKNQMDFIYFQF